MVDYTKRPAPSGDGGGGAGVSLSKVTLTKSAPSISLAKGQGASGQMRINLNWAQTAAPTKGLFRKARSSGVDLDLAALWELQDGRKGVVQALGNAFGSLDSAPYVMLDGDDRSGQNAAGETLTVNLDRLSEIKRVLVFAFIYEGTPNWAAADGVVTLHPIGAAPIEIRLDETSNSAITCAIAMLTNDGGALRVDREVRYINGSQAELDKSYGWGMQWAKGRK